MIEGEIDREKGKNAKDVLRSRKFCKKEVIFHVAYFYKWQRRGVIDACLKDMGKKKKKFLNSQSHFHDIEIKLRSKLLI